MQYATTRDGVRIAYGTAGSGPWLVRVPSPPFINSRLEWSQGSDFFDQLAANWSVVQIDPRGSGLSDRNVADYSLEARTLDLEAVVARLGLEKFALHVLGWSGPLGVTYTVRNPERVTHLILDDAQARVSDFMNIPQVRALDQLTSDWDSFLEFLVFTTFGLGREQAGPYIEYMRECVTPEDARRVFSAARNDDASELLSKVTVPALVIQHTGGLGHAVDAARELAAGLPNARLLTLAGLATEGTDAIVSAMAELMGTEPTTHAGAGAVADHDHHAPSGVRTILFTDIVGHTEMMARLGDGKGREALREHERITREVLKAHGGDEVKSMGDGFMASFGSVSGAVECAIALQRAFQERNSKLETQKSGAEISVRIGLNAGEPIEEGGDLFGATVIMASRIAAAAGGGEILVADTIRGLCSGKGFLFADRGENVLRGFEDAVRLYEVRWGE